MIGVDYFAVKRECDMRAYSAAECIFAWICFLSAFIFCRLFPVHESPLASFLFIVGIFTVTTVIILLRGVKLSVLSVIAAVSAILISAAVILSDNGFLIFFSYVYAINAFFYFVYAALGNSVKNGFQDLIVADYIKAVFVMPFHSITAFFKALFSGKIHNGGKLMLKLALGILIAFVPTVIVTVLLMYDSGFEDILYGMIPSFDFDLLSYLGSLIWSIPIGMYIYGLFISSADKKCADILSEEKCSAVLTKIKIAPTVTAVTAVIPLLFIYTVFFISQWKYYVSGFTGVLPPEFSYAQYARDGFFELCIVSFINLTVVGFLIAFMKRNGRASKVIFKCIAVIFSLITLVLITTALSKMFMYIECYGLTPLRVYATWFMAVLAAVFFILILKQFIPKMKYVAVSISVCIAMFAALSLCNVDSIIAEYNVDRYLDGTIDSVDMYAMNDLGISAVPALCRLAEEYDRENGTDITTGELDGISSTSTYYRLSKKLHGTSEYLSSDEYGIFDFTFPKHKAKKALIKLGIMEEN